MLVTRGLGGLIARLVSAGLGAFFGGPADNTVRLAVVPALTFFQRVRMASATALVPSIGLTQVYPGVRLERFTPAVDQFDFITGVKLTDRFATVPKFSFIAKARS
jgi:hypothetical protein